VLALAVRAAIIANDKANFTRFAVSTRRACLACIKLIEDEFGPLWSKSRTSIRETARSALPQ